MPPPLAAIDIPRIFCVMIFGKRFAKIAGLRPKCRFIAAFQTQRQALPKVAL